MKLNKRLIAKMIKRIEEVPESYDQTTTCRRGVSGVGLPRPEPICGTTECLAGHAIICSERSPRVGVDKLMRMAVRDRWEIIWGARDLMGLTTIIAERLFCNASAETWPAPFDAQFNNAKTYKGQARAAINLLKAILKTDGKILEG